MQKDKFYFFLYTLIFLISALIIFSALNYAYFDQVVKNKQLYLIDTELTDYLNQHNNSIGFLFFGDSHTKDDIDPNHIDNSFNLATGDLGGYLLFYFYLKDLIYTKEVDIEYLVLEIDPNSFNDLVYPRPLHIENLWFWSEKASYNEISEMTGMPVVDVYIRSNIQFIGSGKLIEALINKPIRSDIYRGYVGNRLNLSNDPDINKSVEHYYKATIGKSEVKLNEDGAGHFIKMMDLAKKENIKVILVKYPLSKQYLDYIQKQGFNQSEYYEKLFEKLENKDYEYITLDYQNIFNDSRYFGDVGHLNVEGAEILSKKFSSDIINISKNR